MPDDVVLPEIYADQFTVNVNPFGVLFGLGVAEPSATGAARMREVAHLRMSLEHAKVMAMVLRKVLVNFEREHAISVAIPRAVLSSMGLSPDEDW